jgi:hypothetical protein
VSKYPGANQVNAGGVKKTVGGVTGGVNKTVGGVTGGANRAVGGVTGGVVGGGQKALGNGVNTTRSTVGGATGQANKTLRGVTGGVNKTLGGVTGQASDPLGLGGVTGQVNKKVGGATSQANKTLGGVTGGANKALGGVTGGLSSVTSSAYPSSAPKAAVRPGQPKPFTPPVNNRPAAPAGKPAYPGQGSRTPVQNQSQRLKPLPRLGPQVGGGKEMTHLAF